MHHIKEELFLRIFEHLCQDDFAVNVCMAGFAIMGKLCRYTTATSSRSVIAKLAQHFPSLCLWQTPI